MRRYIWEINFDLDTKLLQENYPSDNWRKAYNDIFVFMNKNGFEHRQGSGYISKEQLHEIQINKKIKELATACPWIDKCVKEIDKTIANERVSCKDIIHKTVQELENERQSVRAAAMTGQHFSSGRKR